MPCENRSAVTAPRVRPLTRLAMAIPQAFTSMRALSPRWKAPRHHARLENLEDLLARGAEANGALHVRDETRPLRPPEGEERDGDELANLRGDVLAVAQPELVDVVVGLDEFRVLPGRELPLGVDVAARLFHPRDEGVRPLGTVARCRVAHGSPPCESVRGARDSSR